MYQNFHKYKYIDQSSYLQVGLSIESKFILESNVIKNQWSTPDNYIGNNHDIPINFYNI